MNRSIIIANTVEESEDAWDIKFMAVFTNTTYMIQWNGCIKTLNINSFNHVFSAWDFPSPILSIEYVIVIRGAIIIKNAIVSIRFMYENKYNIVTPTNIIYTTSDPTPTLKLNAQTFSPILSIAVPQVSLPSTAPWITVTNELFISIVIIIIKWRTNISAKLITQSLNMFLYFTLSSASVDNTIRIPTYNNIPNRTTIDKFLNA